MQLLRSYIALPWPHPCLTATMGKVRVNFSYLSSLSCLLQYGGWPFTPKSLITSQQIMILTWNFQDIFLGVKEHHALRQEGLFHPCLQSGTLKVLQVPPFLTHLPDTLLIEISTQNVHGIFHKVKEHYSWYLKPNIWRFFLRYRRNDWSTDALIGKMEVSKEINHVQSFLGVRSAPTRF